METATTVEALFTVILACVACLILFGVVLAGVVVLRTALTILDNPRWFQSKRERPRGKRP